MINRFLTQLLTDKQIMIHGKTGTFENFGGTEESWKEMIFKKTKHPRNPEASGHSGFACYRGKHNIRNLVADEKSWKNMLSKKFKGIRTFGMSMLNWKNGTFEGFRGTEASWKNMLSGKFGGIQTFGISMSPGKRGTFQTFGAHICRLLRNS